jgi:hypothetical protein
MKPYRRVGLNAAPEVVLAGGCQNRTVIVTVLQQQESKLGRPVIALSKNPGAKGCRAPIREATLVRRAAAGATGVLPAVTPREREIEIL